MFTAQGCQLAPRRAPRVAAKAPRWAGKVLATVIEPVVLRPVETGYEGDVRLKNGAAALAGGRVCDGVGCGGAMLNFLSTARTALSMPIAGRIYPNRVTRGLRGALASAP